MAGKKPKLAEVGPFTYEEKWEKVNVTWFENGNKVTFGQKKTYFFRQDLSVSDEDTLLILPNLPMLVSPQPFFAFKLHMVFLEETICQRASKCTFQIHIVQSGFSVAKTVKSVCYSLVGVTRYPISGHKLRKLGVFH